MVTLESILRKDELHTEHLSNISPLKTCETYLGERSFLEVTAMEIESPNYSKLYMSSFIGIQLNQ